jgi:putative ABC transporter, ATP-binding protein
MTNKVIDAKNIRKTFGKSLAIDDISFSIAEGQIFVFLGPSGSGKTTTITILTGQLVVRLEFLTKILENYLVEN